MSLNSRQAKLIDYLSNQRNIMTIEDYASKLGVSKRTVSYDLKGIIPYLKSKGIIINAIPGVGLEVNKDKVKQQVNELEVAFNRYDRQDSIIIKLLFDEDILTYHNLSETYFVSKSSLRNDFRFLRDNYTNTSTAKIVSNHEGTRLQGNEEQFRESFMLFNVNQVKRENGMENDFAWKIFLQKYYGKFLVNACADVIDSLELSGISIVAHHYTMNLLNILTIMVYRVKHGKKVGNKEHDLIVNELWNMPNILLAKDILIRISKKTKIQFSEAEMLYLVKYLIANRVSFSEIKLSISEEITLKSITQEIISNMNIALHVNLDCEGKLCDQLMRHLKPMIYRLSRNIKIVNPLLNEIKNEFRLIFHLLSIVLESTFDRLSLNITEDEIAFIVIYFQAAVDKVERSKRVLVVCPMGISTSQLVVNRIRNILPPLDILEVASVSQMMSTNLSGIDFVISTVPIELEGTPYVVVSPLVNENDVKNISKFYNKTLTSENTFFEDNEEKEKLLQVIFSSCIFIDDNSSSQEEVINNACCQLCKQGFVNKKFRNSVSKRETLGSTGLPSGAAIPHGLMKNVKKNCVAIYINKNSIKWGDVAVKAVCFLCIKENEHHLVKLILSDLIKLLKDKKKVEELANCSDKQQVIELIRRSIS